MTELVEFYCPTHGHLLDAFPTALVQCACGKDATPEGVIAADHRKAYFTRRRVRRLRERAAA